MLEIKNTATNLNNSFDGLINRLDITEERIGEFDSMSIKTSQTEMERETIGKNQTDYPRTMGQLQKMQ